MDFLVVHSLKAVQSVMISDKHCYEMYGYDIMVDEDLKVRVCADALRAVARMDGSPATHEALAGRARPQPWLLEANASPSLSTTTPDDKALKMRVINDTLRVVSPTDWSNIDTRCGAAWGFATWRANHSRFGCHILRATRVRVSRRRTKAFPDRVGCLDLLYNESSEMASIVRATPKKASSAIGRAQS